MGLLRFLPQFRDGEQLEQNDRTYAAIENMYSGSDERDIFDFAAGAGRHREPASVQRPMLVGHRGGNDRAVVHEDLEDDAALFREIMR